MKILLAYKAFPFTMANYFRKALERRNDVELKTVGEFFGQWIPWNGGMQIPMKYPNFVDIPLGQGMDRVSYRFIKGQLGGWEPDLVLNVDAGFHFSDKPDVPYAVVATDPHVLGSWYANVRPLVDYFFNMQPTYMQPGDILLPYAFDPYAHAPENEIIYNSETNTVEHQYECAIVGLHYTQRDEWVRRLRELGIRVNYRIGDIWDEYRHENNKAWIGLNWSSEQDVTARVFEIMAMRKVPVLNRLEGLNYFGFEEGRHYLGFSSMEEAVAQVQWAIANRPFAEQIALNAYQFVHERNMTWDSRLRQILRDTKLLV